MLELSEPINVWVFFRKSTIEPYLFFWNQRQIKIDKINLCHQNRNGSSLFYHFSVSAGGNFYRLGFDTTSLKWTLEAVEEG
ncbi:hypothetical protein A3E86_02060 [Candidatus Daviesbacteria bacterium RIFCSPHIGHO2_12_FULL_47_45]|nr:MAG: hypothetical protein A3E86_02060 [Candidatus Daviesbacteria bacterium RIFCSPHIGHO2_12_FULL_47_45]